MERLREKGFLKRQKMAGIFHYAPAERKGKLFQRLLSQFVEAAFGGSHAPLVAYFAERGNMTEQELRMPQKIADRLDAAEE